jgi:hypothetical protein
MGLSTRPVQAKSRLYGLFRVALGASVLGGGIWLGTATVASPPAGAARGCLTTSVDVKTHNKTSVPLDLDRARHGLSNTWCTLPGNPVGPHKVARFEAGDDFFATDVSVSYVAPNHDTISLFAQSGFDTDGARCLVVPNGNLPSPYRCSATWRADVQDRGAIFGLGTHIVLVDWVIEGP